MSQLSNGCKAQQRTHDVDTTELLHEHDNTRAQHTLPVTGDGDHLDELAAPDVGVDLLLGLKDLMGEVQVTSGEQRGVTHAEHGVVSLAVFALGDVPTRGLGAEEDLGHDEKRRDGGGAQHQSPVQANDAALVGNVVESELEYE